MEITVSLKFTLKPGTGDMFKANNHILWGKAFYLKNYNTGKFEGPYHLKESYVEDGSFKAWLAHGMVWVCDTAGFQE
jgi:hypothetical protein